MSKALYRVFGPTGEVVLDTSRAPEAFIKARQINGRARRICEYCNTVMDDIVHIC